MGTSKSYNMPSGGEWRPLKTAATAFSKQTTHTPAAKAKLLRNYMRAMGGAQAISGRTRTGGSGSGGGGSAIPATAAAQQIGSLFAGVAESGLEETLRTIGLEQFIGSSAADILAALLEWIAGPASALDEAAARDAVVALTEQLFAEAATAEDLEALIQGAVTEQGVEGVVQEFFAEYLHTMFVRDFFETWQRKEGEDRASAMLKEVREYIRESVVQRDREVEDRRVDWFGPEGATLCQEILEDTVTIFEVEQ